jgi:hypothetical protein
MKVFTYYMPVPDLWSEESQRALIDIWARSWAKAGWEPVVLTEDDAKAHPGFSHYREKFWALPTEYGHDYEGGCFMRWLAVARAGGGMMVDYDVINYGFLPSHIFVENKMTIYADNPPTGVFMGAVSGHRHHFQEMADIFAAWEPDQNDLNSTSASADYQDYHCSDLTMLVRMFDDKTSPKPNWLTRRAGCALFPHPTWETSKLVHYAYAMRAADYWPKHEHIEKIRAF